MTSKAHSLELEPESLSEVYPLSTLKILIFYKMADARALAGFGHAV